MSFYRYMYRCLFCVFLVSVESATVVALTAGCVLVGLVVWMVVRFFCVIRVPLCACVSRVCPVCVPAPPGVFLPAHIGPVLYR